MMARVLKLKTPIVDYFRRHSNNARKLTSHEWRVTNEVCSLLGVVAEVTIKIQGGADTHIGHTMFNMMDIKEIFTEEDHNIRTPDQTYGSSGDILKGRMGVDDLSQEAQLLIVGKKSSPGYPLSEFARFWIRGAKTAPQSISSTATYI